MYEMTRKVSVIESMLFPKAANCTPAYWLTDEVAEGRLFPQRGLAILVLDIFPSILECDSAHLYD